MESKAPEHLGNVAASRQQAKVPQWVWWLLVPLMLVLTLIPWAVAAPLGGAPDSDFHLNTILCVQGDRPGLCEHVSDTEVRVNADTELFYCHAKNVADAPLCYDEGAAANPETTVTKRWNYNGVYPNGYFLFHSLHASPDLTLTVMSTRILNVVLISGLLGVLGGLLAPRQRMNLWLAFLVTSVPLGLSILSSINPSAWSIPAPLMAFFAVRGALLSSGKRRLGLWAMAGLAAILGASSRTDALVFVALAVVAALFLHFDFKRSDLRNAVKIGLGLGSLLLVGVIILVVTGRVMQAPVIGNLAASLQGDPPAGVQPRKVIFENFLNIPDYLMGVFGLWPLGLLEIQLPRLVPAVFFGIFLAMMTLALLGTTWKTNLVLVFLAVLGFLMPLLMLFYTKATVGVWVQPRYLLPLIALFAGVALFDFSAREHLPLVHRVVILIAASGAHLAAFGTVVRRYWQGMDFQSGEQTWWWDGAPGPVFNIVLAGGAFLAFTASVLLGPAIPRAQASESELFSEVGKE